MPRYAVAVLRSRPSTSTVEIWDDDDLVAMRLICEPYSDWVFAHRISKCLDDFGPVAEAFAVDAGSSRFGEIVRAFERAGVPVRESRA